MNPRSAACGGRHARAFKRCALAFAAAGIVGACASFSATDAGPGISDASADSPVVDASGDTGGDESTGAMPTSEHFADNFDDGVLGAKWTQPQVVAPATLALRMGEVVSQPNALIAEYPTSGNPVPGALLMRRFDRPTKTLDCDVKLFVEDHAQAPATPSVLHVDFLVPTDGPLGDTWADLSLNEAITQLTVLEKKLGQPQYKDFSPFSLDKWVEVRLTIDAVSGAIALLVDGTLTTTASFPQSPQLNAGVEVKLGLFGVAASDAARVRLDDFSCDVVFE